MLKKSSIIRVFFGLPVDDRHIKELHAKILAHFAGIEQQARWIRFGNYHVTVRFIGNIPEQKLPLILDSVQSHLDDLHNISININKIAHFPSEKSKLIVAYVEVNEELQRLYDAVESGLTLAGIPPERRAYKPHITLCRPRPHRIFHLPAIDLTDFRIDVTQLILFQSLIEEEGSRYLPLFRKKFK